ncbi:MAG: hypothetical protein AB1297_01165 [bacterium]
MMAIASGTICGIIVFVIAFIKAIPIIWGIIFGLITFITINFINIIIKSIHSIGPNEVGLIIKRFFHKREKIN